MIFRFLFIYPGITRISDFLFDIFLLNSHERRGGEGYQAASMVSKERKR